MATTDVEVSHIVIKSTTAYKILIAFLSIGISIGGAAIGAAWQESAWKTATDDHLRSIDYNLSQQDRKIDLLVQRLLGTDPQKP